MMGLIGIKVWIFRGELEPGQWSPPNIKTQTEREQGQRERGERGERGDRGDRGDRQGKSGRKPRKAG